MDADADLVGIAGDPVLPPFASPHGGQATGDFVPGFFRFSVVYPPHFRVQENLSSDFGNQHGVCWQSLMAYCTEKNYTSHGEGTIIHYYTA